MAQGSQQLDYQILLDLKQRFPEIPEGVVSQCMLQNNNNLEACCRVLSQESSKYLYGEYHSPEEGRLSRNHMLHINLGIHSPTGYHTGDGGKANGGGRTLVHSSSDGHIDPQRAGAAAGGGGAGGATQHQMVSLLQETHSAPAIVAPSPGYNPFFVNDQARTAGTPPPGPPALQGLSPTLTPVARYALNPITVTLSQSIPSAPRALQIPGCPYPAAGNAVYIRPASSQSPQGSPWHSPTAQCHMQPYSQQPPHAMPVYQAPPYQSPYPSKQMPQTAYRSPPPSQFPSPYSSPQHQTSHVFMPISPPTMSPLPYHPQQQQQSFQQQQQGQPVSYIPYLSAKGSLKNQIEITLEAPQRAHNRSSSPVTSQQQQQRGQNTLYISTNASPSSPSRGLASGQVPPRPRPTSSPQPGGGGGVRVTQPGNSTYTFKIKVSPGRQVQPRHLESPTVEAESLLNLVEHGEHPGAPQPIQPISALPGAIGAHAASRFPRKSSSGSDDYAYTQALLLHQRARMERLAKELHLEKQKLEKLKADVNDMEYDALRRRFRRVNASALIPRPEEMTRLRSLNRQLQIDIDCTLKEIDLLQSRGKFDPKAMSNFYDNIQPGPVVPPKPTKKEGGSSAKTSSGAPPRDEDFEGAQWNCESCTFLNHPALNRCEQCEMPRYT
uniref:TGF-beta-activated kinase 1 and MAP3K7-binding protein 2 n=1 Tax=Lepisosteus oculatus TaxID=7918 RepID=W5MW12_LEPOC